MNAIDASTGTRWLLVGLLRWPVCLIVVVVHWFLVQWAADWYVDTFVTPRTGFYTANRFWGVPPLGILGTAVALMIALTTSRLPPYMLLLVRSRLTAHSVLLLIWCAFGLWMTLLAAISEIRAGREFWPDVVFIGWSFAFVPLVAWAMLATRRAWAPTSP
jgi:hypothetical protein